MKTLVLLMIAAISSIAMSAQDKLLEILPVKNNKVTYSNVIKLDGLTKAEIYNKAHHWLAYNCEMININSPDELVGRGYFRFSDTHIWESITIKIKDGLCKYEISNFQIRWFESGDDASRIKDIALEDYNSLFRKKLYNSVDEQTNSLINSLEEYIKSNVEESW